MRLFIVIFAILFIGCSIKLNPASYNPYPAEKAKIIPTEREINFKPNIIIYSKNDVYSQYSKNILEYILNSSNLVNLPQRNTTLKDEIALAQEAKAANANLNQADYIIKTEITSKNYTYKYHPAVYYKDKKGKIHRINAYFSYSACIEGYIKIYSLIPFEIKKILNLNECYSSTSENFEYLKDYLLKTAIKNAVYDNKVEIFKFFAPKGFIFEIRKKDDFIIHTTLGSDKGAKAGERVDIYTRKKIKLPFGPQEKTEDIKIGEGIISNIVNKKNSWVIVEKLNGKLHIGDYVKPNFRHSFWDIFR